MNVYKHTNSVGKDYYLNADQNQLKNQSKPRTYYYFSSDIRPTGIPAVPAGWRVIENKHNKTLFLKRKE